MNIEEQYRKPNLKSEPRFYFNSDEMKANIAFVKEKKIDNLMLISNENGYNLKDLDFLKELPFLKELHMGACPQIENFEGLSSLKNLQLLIFKSDVKVDVDLSALTNLDYLGFSFTNKITGLNKLINLKTIGVNNGTESFFNIEIFKNYKKLKDLKIALSIIPNGLDFLKENTALEYLEFNYMKRAFSINGIQFLKKNLKKLKLISCKKINDIDLISELENLEWLILSESVKLQDAKILKPLNKLEALTLYGSSSFIDGDLTSLKEMRDTIKHFKVQNKKHYFYE
ncbi:hypothetical protein [Lacinutrix sp. MEBiC02595]